MTLAKGILFSEPYYSPRALFTSSALPNATLVFLLSRTSGQLEGRATVYQDSGLTTPYMSNVVTASSTGRFPVIYLVPYIPLRVQLFNQYGKLLQDVDPYIPSGRFTGAAVVPIFATDQQNNTTTLIPDPYLNIALPHAGTYRYELYAELVLGDTGNNPGIVFSMSLESGLTFAEAITGGLLQDIPPGLVPNVLTASPVFAADYFADPGSGTTYQATSAFFPIAYPTTLSTTNHTPLHVTGVVTCTKPCTLAFCWAPGSSVSTELIIVRGSYLKVQSIAPNNNLPPIQVQPALTVTVSPGSFTVNAFTAQFTTPSTTVFATGGASSYTYAWSWLSGGTGISINSPASSATSFTANGMTPTNTYSGTAQCVVTDARGNTAIAQVPVSITYVSSTDYIGTVTLGTASVFSRLTTGFLQSNSLGSISAPADNNGNAVLALTVSQQQPPVSPAVLTFTLQGNLPQNYVPSITFPGVPLGYSTAAASSYTSGGGTTTWTWSAATNAMPWLPGATGTFTWTLP